MKNMLKKLSISILLLSALFSFSSCDPTQLFNPEPEIIQINFDPAPFNYSPELTPGQRVQMNWIYLTSDGYTHDVSNTGEYSLFTVTSSDPNVCYFSDGYLIALNPGSVIITIRANNGGAMQYIDFYVKSGRSTSVEPDSGSENPSQATYTASSIDIDTTSTSLVKGESFYINYSVYPYYANDSVTCSSSDPSVVQASVYYNGCIYVYAVDYGTATITIKSNDNPNVTAKCKITVNDGYNPTYTVTSVTLSDEYLFLDINETAVLTASIYPSSAPSELKWESSKPEVVSVSSGKITALKAGTAIITATSKDNPGKSATCEVTVSNNKYIQVTGLSFTNTSVSVGRGEETTVTVNVQPSNANPKLTWYTSSSSSYFTYSPDETNPAKCKITGLKEGGGYLYVKLDSDSSIYSYVYVTVTKPTPASANQYFWGTWIRMDNGKMISIEDTQLVDGATGNSYDITKESTETKIVINGSIGNGITYLSKKTQNVIEAKEGDALIPFYRKGGTDLDYTLKVVGTAGMMNRAASGLSGLKVRGTSNKYKSFTSDAETTTDGSVTLKAPVQGDVQTVSIELPAEGEEEAKSVVVENLKIENSGDYMGTVALAGEGDYSLKITGTIDESEKTDGYLYAGHTYTMHLEIKNISDVPAKYSVLSITPQEEDDFITLSSTDIPNLKAYSVPTIKPGMYLQKDIKITIGSFSDEKYKDTKINIEIINDTGWIDYVPIRVFGEQAKITFNAGKVENTYASLNGFLIYPDGNSQFFSVRQGNYQTISVPRFKPTDEYTLVFSGATVNGTLSDSTELYYTVSLSATKKAIHDDTEITYQELRALQKFGEDNETEDDAYAVDGDFEAYIAEGETDFYKIKFTD